MEDMNLTGLNANTLSDFRKRIDQADDRILEAFIQRMDIVEQLSRFKRKNAIALEDKSREKGMFEREFKGQYAPLTQKLLLEIITLSKTYQRRMLNIYLTGMPASGKSEAAKAIAAQVKRESADTDRIVADRADASIERIFEIEGEEGFREREREALSIVAEHGNLIVATGGGILTNKQNADIMHSSGYIIFLDVPLDRLLKTPITGRPLISSSDDVTRLYYERIVDYKSNADLAADPEAPDFMARVIAFMRERVEA